MHEGEHHVPTATARALVAEAFPELAGLPVRRVRQAGTVNAVFRVGDCHAARFALVGDDPQAAHRALLRETRAASELAAVCPVPAPAPLGVGAPGHGYPLPFTVQTWVPGRVAAGDGRDGGDLLAHDLATLVTTLRGAPTHGRTFTGAGRGGHLPDHDTWVEQCLRRSAHLVDVAPLERLWARLRDLGRTAPDVMSHGDLMPANLVTAGGRLRGVLDTGGFAPADPALDVTVAWQMFDDGPRDVFRVALGCDDLEWQRGRAWAFEQAVGALWYYDRTHAGMAATARRTLARVVAGP